MLLKDMVLCTLNAISRWIVEQYVRKSAAAALNVGVFSVQPLCVVPVHAMKAYGELDM
jgi:hypothetical protein